MAADYVRGGNGTVRPYLYARPDMVSFVQTVFGASVIARHDTPLGAHVEAAIGDSVIILEAADQFPDHVEPTVASVYIYVEDVDSTYTKALQGGASSISEPEDKPYDERQAGIRDSFGNTWWISSYIDPER